jgi:hypothetical protein
MAHEKRVGSGEVEGVRVRTFPFGIPCPKKALSFVSAQAERGQRGWLDSRL